MINRVVLIGRLTKDPMIRKTQTGKSVTSFTVAVNRRSSQNDQTDFIRCVAWEKTAEILSQYAKKGSLISLEGKIQTGSYDDKDGKRVYTQDVVADFIQLLESKSVNEAKSTYEPYQVDVDYNDYSDQNQEEGPVLDISSDDLPF